MKSVKFILMALMLFFAGHTYAQTNLEQMSDKELSEHFKQQASILNAKANLVKTQLKADKNNGTLKAELVQIKNDVKKMQENKKVIDKAIKTQQKAEKAIAAAEAAQKKAEDAKNKAMKLKNEAEEAARKALYIKKG